MNIVKITEDQARDIRSSDEPPTVICARHPHLIEEDVRKIKTWTVSQLHPSWRIR
jgi:hypothetical protein